MKTAIAVSLICASTASVAHADLRFTTHVDVRRTPVALAESLPGEFAATLQGLMSPGERRIFIRADSMRIEQQVGPTSTVVLIRPDGQFVLYPDSQTYVRMPALGGNPAAQARTQAPIIRRTGEFATFLGLRSERVLVTTTIALPVTPPAGFPTSATLEGEIWLTDAYRAEAVGAMDLMGPVARVANGLGGMVLKQVFRSPQLGYEIETRVTELVEGPIDAALFQIPAGYRRVEKLLTPAPPAGARR